MLHLVPVTIDVVINYDYGFNNKSSNKIHPDCTPTLTQETIKSSLTACSSNVFWPVWIYVDGFTIPFPSSSLQD